jgi:hypothetical protein
MKRPLIYLGTVLLALSGVRADLVVVQKVSGIGGLTQMTLKLKDGKIRTEVAPEMSTIMDMSTGDMLTIMHSQKMYMKVSGEQSKKLMQSMLKQKENVSSVQPTQAPQLKSTGRHEKVSGYDTEVFTIDTDAMKGTFWVAKDVPGGDELKTMLKAMQKSPMGAMAAAMVQQPDLPGVPVKSEIQMGSGQKMTVTLVSVKQQAIDASEMAPPAGYTEMPMPSFPGAGAMQPPAGVE